MYNENSEAVILIMRLIVELESDPKLPRLLILRFLTDILADLLAARSD